MHILHCKAVSTSFVPMVFATTDINLTKQLLSPVSRSYSSYTVDKGHLINDNLRTLHGRIAERDLLYTVVTSHTLLAERPYNYSNECECIPLHMRAYHAIK